MKLKMKSLSKRRKRKSTTKQDKETTNGIDRISELPDSILSQIISRLPTKNAVATCILSTRWKNLHPFSIVTPMNLDLDESNLLNPQNRFLLSFSTCFQDFVDKLLNVTLVDAISVPKVTFKCGANCPDAKILSWVSAVLRMNVQHLVMKQLPCDSINLFNKLNGCISLTRLELGEFILIENPDEFRLPNLKRLDLYWTMFESCDAMNELMDSCPKLLELHLSYCDPRLIDTLCIRSPLLESLFIDNPRGGSSLCTLVLDVPRLQVLMLKNCFATKFVASKFNHLIWAHIDVGPGKKIDFRDKNPRYHVEDFWYDEWAGLIGDCSRANRLHLNCWSIEALHQPNSFNNLPLFSNLTSLSLGSILKSKGWGVLAQILCNAPKLEKLALSERFKACKDGYANFERFVSTTPVCLELHLKEIDFLISSNEEDEIKLVEYFLKNGKVIERLNLNCGFLGRLFCLPERSKIHFT